jgi:RNA polymerase sigma-70 factor (ECF subfamily)
LITTSVSLLHRLQQSADSRDWQRFVHLYTPLLLRWARRAGAQDADAADLTQDVLLLLVHKLPTFDHKGPQSFRGWLRTLLLNKWRDLCRYRAARPARTDDVVLETALDRNGDGEEQEDREDRERLVARALELIRGDFQPHVWRAFWELFAAGRDAGEVAAELGVRVAVVYSAKCRVLRSLRQELDGLLD